MSLIDSPSLANITGTHLDSACKHIQQCKVSHDHMLLFVEGEDELQKEKMRFCAHKDEMIVGIGRPWKRSKTRTLAPCAYPRIVSNLGNIASKEDEKYKLPRQMIVFLFHTARDIFHRQLIVERMNDEGGFGSAMDDFFGKNLDADNNFFHDAGQDKGASSASKHVCKSLSKYLDRMFDFYPVGVCNTIAYASPRTGDTVGSVMIGGLRTVMNGHWEVHAGDIVQWYWDFEMNCFDKNGARKKYQTFDEKGDIASDYFGMSPFETVEELPAATAGAGTTTGQSKRPDQHTANKAADARRQFNDRQYGIKPQSLTPSDKSKSVARIKTYVKDEQCPRLYDSLRIFGRAIGTARPGELLDIQINRQSM